MHTSNLATHMFVFDFILYSDYPPRVKNNIKGGASGSLNEDTLGGQLKAGLAQFVALEIAKASCRDKKAIIKYLPWLYHPPSTVQQG